MRNGQVSLADCRNNIARNEKSIAVHEQVIADLKIVLRRCKEAADKEHINSRIAEHKVHIRERKANIRKYKRIQEARIAKGFKV